MNRIPLSVPDLILLEPRVFSDARGYFLETYHRARYAEFGITADFVQDNESFSARNVLRGLHYQRAPYAQAKLIHVIEGVILDVALDLRRSSPTFGRFACVELDGTSKRQLFIPRGFAHGFLVLSETARFAYKCDAPYRPESECGIAFDDPQLNIPWGVPEAQVILSDRDRRHPPFARAVDLFA